MTLPESDSMVINDGSGSGYPVNNIDHRDDDEDYNDGSGSGNYPDGSSSSSKSKSVISFILSHFFVFSISAFCLAAINGVTAVPLVLRWPES